MTMTMTMISGEVMSAGWGRTQTPVVEMTISYCPYTETLAPRALIYPHLQRHLVQNEMSAVPSPNHLPSPPLALH